ncbi:MAG TPA: DUF4397 domain-containing protein [Gemmatimonadales bacterium]|nr:DUF4397 domain-containing protein [Gemmatimonadales bacterium]
MRNAFLLGTVLLAGFLTGACESSDPGDNAAQVRLIHARSGAPAVDLVVGGESVLDGIAFSQASGFAEVPAGSATLQVRPAAGGAAIVGATTTFEPGARYTLLFSNSGGASDLRIAPDTATGLPLAPPPTSPSDTGAIPGESKVKLRVIHNAADAPPLDVYLTLYQEPLAGAIRLVEPFTYGVGLNPDFPGYVERDPGTWQVRFTADGTDDVLIDTGPITLAAGQVKSIILFSSDTTGMGIAIVRER